MDGAVLRRWLPFVAVLALLGAAMFAAVYSNPVISTDPLSRVRATELPSIGRPAFSAPPRSDPFSGPPAPPYDMPAWLSWAITVVCGLAVAVVVGGLIWFAVRDMVARRQIQVSTGRGAPDALRETRQLVRGAIDEGLAGLDDTDVDPRRAIIACWVRLEQAASDAGVPRGGADTATDLVRRLLGTHLVVSAPVLDSLAGAYLEARFTEHVLSAGVRERAIGALRQLRAELDRAVSVGEYGSTGVPG